MTNLSQNHFYPEASDLTPTDEVLAIGSQEKYYLEEHSQILDTVEVSEDLIAVFAIKSSTGEFIEPFLVPKTSPVELKPPF